jgi:predicted RNA-binding protein with PIN domain
MPYVVDGNNLIGRLAGRACPAEEDRRRLVGELAGRLRRSKARVTLVFDGGSSSGSARESLGALEVRYGGARSADSVIVEIVEGARSPKDWHVVTDDRALASRVREAGARSMPALEFWDRFAASADGGRESGSAGREEDWIGFFSDERNRLS